MTDTQVLEIVIGALEIAAKLAMPVLIMTLVIGVVVSLFQAVTQVQEMTLSFVPKLIGVGIIVMLGGSWMVDQLVMWVTQLWDSIPGLL